MVKIRLNAITNFSLEIPGMDQIGVVHELPVNLNLLVRAIDWPLCTILSFKNTFID